MTEDEPAPDPDDEDELYEVFLRLQRGTFHHVLPDPLLGIYVSYIDRGLFSVKATLTVDGMVITGLLVSTAEYMRHLAESIDAAVGPETGLIVTSGLRATAQFYEEKNTLDDLKRASDDRPAPTPDDPQPSALEVLQEGPRSVYPMNLHLLDATIWQAGRVVTSEVAWRGRLSMVSGWSIGTFGG